MKPNCPSRPIASARVQDGVALVMTLILLAVITFLAVTFLVLSQRERNATNSATEATTARFAAEAGFERAKAELMARMLGARDIRGLGLIVATNYQNPLGFDPTLGSSPTNVNYGWTINGTPLTTLDYLQNQTNLLYDPRAPVFVTNRYFANSNDFRFYIDLNRNGRYDTNGWGPVVFEKNGSPGTYVYYDTNGTEYPYPGPPPQYAISNYFIGDPEWRGILTRPDEFHGPNNRFLSRYTFMIMPVGNTLDINYIHNHAKLSNPIFDGFYRNQGVGSWEINLASFLVDLNTNLWLRPPPFGYAINQFPPYQYNTNYTVANLGAAFDDANQLIRYRYEGAVNTWDGSVNATVFGLYGNPGQNAFWSDWIDGYGKGPLMTDYRGLAYQGITADPDTINEAPGQRTQKAWGGGYFRKHFFSTQDLFDQSKLGSRIGFDFPERISLIGTNEDSYNRYTFTRLCEQLGTDSTPDPNWKLNLNYANVGGYSVTNFLGWGDPILTNTFKVSGGYMFFTNAADRLIRLSTATWLSENRDAFTNTFVTNRAFGIGNIPVLLNKQFVYSASVHRLLQLAANIVDVMTNQALPTTFAPTNQFPTIFRPVCERRGNDVFITGFEEVGPVATTNHPAYAPLRDLGIPADVNLLTPQDNVYGVPWIVGAKKGLPNFNEIAMQSVVEVTRKLQVERPAVGAPQSQWSTNLLYVVGVSNVIGIEAWNSYKTAYPRDVDVSVLNNTTMVLTNDMGYKPPQPGSIMVANVAQFFTIPAQSWQGFGSQQATNPANFRVLLKTNIVFQQDLAFDFALNRFTTNADQAWRRIGPDCPQPQWVWGATNRMRLIMMDHSTPPHILDYVQLAGPTSYFDAGYEAQKPLQGRPPAFADLWNTNRLNPSAILPVGINNQILVSLGDATAGTDNQDWSAYGLGNAQGAQSSSKYLAIANFRAAYGLSDSRYPGGTNGLLKFQVPFTPTARITQNISWQANDPLVHYTAGDLQNLFTTSVAERLEMKDSTSVANIGALNSRYEPWGGSPVGGGSSDPKFYKVAEKDPLVRSSDDWDFPTNKFPNIGWLGRVHRGTPWQTVYMKAPDVVTNLVGNTPIDWQRWSGNPDYSDALRTRPIRDRVLFDLFTTAVSENGTRGQMSINQSGMAAWSAIFGGVIALTNTSADSYLIAHAPIYATATDPALANFSYYIQPVGTFGVNITNSPLYRIWEGINRTRGNAKLFPKRTFQHLGDILATPELTTASPFIRTNGNQWQKGINDAVYEWLPQQVMGLLRVGEPRFVVYAYGQTLKPAEQKPLVIGGPYDGMCTNYQITAEVSTRAVLRVDGSPIPGDADYPPRIVVESFNIVPSD